MSINLTNEFYDIQKGNSFDQFLSLKLPYFNEKGTRAIKINIPIKNHRQSNKLRDSGFKLRDNIQIKNINGQYNICLIWEKEVPIKPQGKELGIDTGFRKLIATSDGQILGGEEMLEVYSNITKNKKKNSVAYKKALLERDNLINMFSNKINFDGVGVVCVEDLCNVKYKSKYNKKANNLMSKWTYRAFLNKIKMICEAKGMLLVKVSPAYTSQTCSSCGSVHEESRKGDNFKCVECGFEIDADYNASINIRNKGVYSLLDPKS